MRKLYLAVVVCLLVSSSAVAQEITVLDELIPAIRQGSHLSQSIVVPLSIAGVQGELELVPTGITSDDLDNEALTLKMTLWEFKPLTLGWKLVAYSVRPGGRVVDEDGVINPVPTMSTSVEGWATKTLRCEVDVSRPVNIGCRVQVKRHDGFVLERDDRERIERR